jgi:hypothetical protein
MMGKFINFAKTYPDTGNIKLPEYLIGFEYGRSIC